MIPSNSDDPDPNPVDGRAESFEGPQWSPNPEFPKEPEFYRRVLHHMPTPLLVVDPTGSIFYANQALLDLGGWDVTDTVDRNILDHIHPEDRDELTTAFLQLVERPGSRLLESRSWAAINFRIVTADGSIMPIEAIGSGGTMDEAVNGIIYEVRPARNQHLVGRLLDGLSQGASMHQLLSLVCEMIASPPLQLQAAVLQLTPNRGVAVAASSTVELTEILHVRDAENLWSKSTRSPTRVAVETLRDDLRKPLERFGYQDLWHVAVESPLTATTLRIVAVSPVHHVPDRGPVNRLHRARELSAAVLLRSQSDVLLDYAAAYDLLTGCPNRAAFYQHADTLDTRTERAAVQLDLDGLKRVNDQMSSAAGDSVLQIIADRLRSVCDHSETIGRIGDDEFAIIFDTGAASDPEYHAAQLSGAVLAAVNDPIVVAGRSITITASIGIAVAGAGVSTDHLLTWVDAAMHDAKRRGGDQIQRYGVSFN